MKRQELLNALKAVAPGVAKDEALLMGSDNFVFGNGLIRSYNDRLSVTYPFDTGVEGAVKAAETIKVLEKMSGNDIELSINGNSLEATDGTTTLSLRLNKEAASEHIAAMGLEELDWYPLPSDFIDAMRLCQASISRNVAHGALTGIRVDGKELLSTDNFRATWVTISGQMLTFTIPGDSVDDLLRLPNLEQYTVTNAWAHFMSKDGAVFSSRLLTSEFPAAALKKMFPKDDSDSHELPKGLEQALERAQVMAYTQVDGNDFVTISEVKGKLLVVGERQFGSIKERLDKGDWPTGMTINVHPGHLLDIMAKTRKFQLIDNIVYFHADNFKHIISTIIKG